MNNQIYLSFSEMPPIFEDRIKGLPLCDTPF